MNRKCQHCNLPHKARGFCRRHYQIFSRSEKFFYQEIKWSKKNSCCIKCKSSKKKHASKGLCSLCYQQTPKAKKYVSEWQKKNKERCNKSSQKFRMKNLEKCREWVRINQIKLNNKNRFGGLREDVMERDSYKCVRCNKDVSEPYQSDIHHKDEDKTNNVMENLETLCNACHARHHVVSVKRRTNGTFLPVM